MSNHIPSPLPDSDSQLNFLLQVLHVTADSEAKPQDIYRLLQANLNKLDDNLAFLLRNWATDTLSAIATDESVAIADNIFNFSFLLSLLSQQFSSEIKASILEIVIAGYESALRVYTRESFQEKWITIHKSLIGVYGMRLRGDRAENLEQAIVLGDMALQVCNFENYPEQWAKTRYNLALIYHWRLRGERVNNLEQAISYYNNALRFFKPESFQKEWAQVKNDLAAAYNQRIRGDRAKNQEEAIAHFKESLKVRTPETFPQEWAATQTNLANAYCDRILGERQENLKCGIAYYNEALKVRISPELWATTHNNLATAYTELSIWQQANKLNISQEEITENIEKAIACCENALKVRTPETLQIDWATTQGNLAIVYRHRIQGEPSENLDKAITYYKNSLSVYTREKYPFQWARNQHNLGIAYRNRIRDEQAKNLEQALACFKNALQVRTREALPQSYALTQSELGITYQNAQQFFNAYNAFDTAIDTIESLRDEIVTRDEGKQKLAEAWNEVYQHMVEVCLELGNLTKAVEYVERSKTRNLVELIFERDTHSIFSPEVASQLEKLRNEIASGQYQLQTTTADDPTTLAQHLQQLRQQRNKLQNERLSIGYGFNLNKFQEILDDHTAIIEWYITSKSFETFIITRYSLQRLILSSPSDDLKALTAWKSEYLEGLDRNAKMKIKNQWRNCLAARLNLLAEILHLDNPNSEDDILRHIPEECDRLILIPHRYLHLFPLHALPLSNGDFLCGCDRFYNGVSYAPSCQLLQLAQQRELHRSLFNRLFIIQNPTRSKLDKLNGTQFQIENICQQFDPYPDSIVLREQEATAAAILTMEQVRSAHCVHFCCHGSFNFRAPLKAALHLAESASKFGADADLTLGEIFEKLHLDQCRLITFSACDTGITDPNSISDEYIGLPSGFLYAGSPSVVSTLWSVDQAATNLFVIEFYKNLKQLLPLRPGSIAFALKQTQKWLRTLTGEELGKLVESPEFQRHLEEIPGNVENKLFKELLDAAKRKSFPYQNPYYWAAFIATGL